MVPFVAASLAAQLALLAGLALFRKEPAADRLVEVKILPLRSPSLAPARGGAPPPPPAPAVRAPRPSAERKQVRPLLQPKAVPDEQPPSPPEKPDVPSSEGAGPGEPGGAAGGAEGGVVGGVSGGTVGSGGVGTAVDGPLLPAAPIPARPKDLEAVRERIAHTLGYPPRAKELRWEGRCLVEFVLLADGAIRDLRVVESSGRTLLDEAALAAVQRAAPFPPPGMDVLVRTPISFRLQSRLG